MNSKIIYHLEELEIARNPVSPYYVMPKISEKAETILDIGCGIGQTFVASGLGSGKLLVGLDVDLDSLLYGHSQFGYLAYVNGKAECLPFHSDSFDFVISRVSLPYTNIPKSLMEIRRVLRRNGMIWLTLHPFSMTLYQLKTSVLKFEIKAVIFRVYVVVNGILFHLFGKQFAFPVRKRYESYQTKSRIVTALKNIGFTNLTVQKGVHFIVTGQKKA